MAISFNGSLQMDTGGGVQPDNPVLRKPGKPVPVEPIPEFQEEVELLPGLPVILARPALIPEQVRIEALPESLFNDVHPGHESIDLEGMQYGLRILREGYLYVIDENQDNKVTGYEITESNRYKPLETGENDSQCLVGSTALSIDDPEAATRPVWFAFSDVMWTEAVISAHQTDAALRERHMVCFDVQKWMADGEHPGAFRMQRLGSRICEMGQLRRSRARALEWSPAPAMRGGPATGAVVMRQAMRTLRSHNLPRDKAVTILLPDPVGFSSDLAALMQYKAESFVADRDEEYRRKTAAGAGIDEIEFVVKENAENALAARVEEEAVSWEFEKRDGFGLGRPRPADKHMAEQIRASLTAEKLDIEVDEVWATYIDRFDVGAWRNWSQAVTDDFQALNDMQIGPMARAHRAWMESDLLYAYLEGNHDPADPESGEAYVGVVSLCIGSSQDKGACFDLYSEWLEADDDNNPLRRALAYNQDNIRESINQAIVPGVSWEALPWDKMFMLFQSAAERMECGAGGVLGQLMAQVTGPLESVVAKAASSHRVYAALAMLGASHGQPFVMVNVSGKGNAFWRMLSSEMARLSGEAVDDVRLRRAVTRRLSRLSARGLPMEQVMSNRWLLMINPDAVKGMPENIKAPGRLEARSGWLAQHVKTPEQVEKLRLSVWQEQVQGRSIQTTRAGASVGLGILGLLTQHVALSGLQGRMMDAMSHQRAEVRRRFFSQWMQVCGAYGELVGRGVETLGRMQFRVARALRMESIGKLLRVAGRYLGAAGAAVMAILDVHEGWKEIKRGNAVRGAGYIALGLMAFLFIVAIFIKAFSVGAIILTITLLFSLMLDYFRPDDIQLWLERCIWGRLESERYAGESVEQKELKRALGVQ
ncbi:MAG: hypothetical protein LAT61_00715 [Alcanivorax sp.]|nr:hypothetical protein [Alcanivorax sp.]